MFSAYLIALTAAIVAYGLGFFLGYGFGRRVGYMVGEELERRKWEQRS